jgi:hypothetical protein
MNSNLIEAANRAEATALLVRSGYRVYRPEADCEGEDLVLRTPTDELIAVQLKGRAYVSETRYGAKSLWLLFPSGPFQSNHSRKWYLVPHDELYAYIHERHGQAPGWNGAWSYPSPPQHLAGYLRQFEVCPSGEQEKAVTK